MFRFLCFGIILLWGNGIQASFINIPNVIQIMNETKEETSYIYLDLAKTYKSFNQSSLEELISVIRPQFRIINNVYKLHANQVREMERLIRHERRYAAKAFYVPESYFEAIIKSLNGASKGFEDVYRASKLYEHLLLAQRRNFKANAQGNFLLPISHTKAVSALNTYQENAFSSLRGNYDDLVIIFSTLANETQSNKYESDSFNLLREIFQRCADLYKQMHNTLVRVIADDSSVVAVKDGWVVFNAQKYLNDFGQSTSEFSDLVLNYALYWQNLKI